MNILKICLFAYFALKPQMHLSPVKFAHQIYVFISIKMYNGDFRPISILDRYFDITP